MIHACRPPLTDTSDPEHAMRSSWLRPRRRVLRHQVSSFQVCGLAGTLLATSLCAVLLCNLGLSQLVMAGLLAAGIVTFLLLAMATKIVTGRESLIYYHHEVAVLAVSGVVLSVLDLPVLRYLDLTALWLGVFLACGRCGCLMVGCCHGKPHPWGVRYTDEHAAEGFPACYVGVRLFPIQPLEALLVAAIVAGGVVLVLSESPPGTALTWYVATYSTARIWLEELRGDWTRPYWLRLSEAQWTSALLLAVLMVGEWQGRLPWSTWHTPMVAFAALSAVALACTRTAERTILHARHAGEIATILRSARSREDTVRVARTSQSVGLSTQSLDCLGSSDAVLFSLSRGERCLSANEARALSGLIANLAGRTRRGDLLAGRHGVFHLLVRNPPP